MRRRGQRQPPPRFSSGAAGADPEVPLLQPSVKKERNDIQFSAPGVASVPWYLLFTLIAHSCSAHRARGKLLFGVKELQDPRE